MISSAFWFEFQLIHRVITDDGLKGEVSSVSVLRQMVKVLVEVDDEKEIRDYSVDQQGFGNILAAVDSKSSV